MDSVGKFIVYMFAVYGVLSLLFYLFSCIKGKKHGANASLKLVLLVKNAEECIEYTVFNITKRILSDRSMPIKTLSIMDMGSNDDTQLILDKLTCDYGAIELIKEKDSVYMNF